MQKLRIFVGFVIICACAFYAGVAGACPDDHYTITYGGINNYCCQCCSQLASNPNSWEDRGCCNPAIATSCSAVAGGCNFNKDNFLGADGELALIGLYPEFPPTDNHEISWTLESTGVATNPETHQCDVIMTVTFKCAAGYAGEPCVSVYKFIYESGSRYSNVTMLSTTCPSNTTGYSFYAEHGGAYSTCTICPKGTYSTKGSTQCTPCPNGGYTTEAGSTSKAKCCVYGNTILDSSPINGTYGTYKRKTNSGGCCWTNGSQVLVN